jgi:hypothetical protein
VNGEGFEMDRAIRPGPACVPAATMRAMEHQNRAQRRRAEFGGSGPTGLAGDADGQNNAALQPEGPDESLTGGQDQSQTRLTGAGTGGATEAPARTPRHSGAHVQHSTNG